MPGDQQSEFQEQCGFYVLGEAEIAGPFPCTACDGVSSAQTTARALVGFGFHPHTCSEQLLISSYWWCFKQAAFAHPFTRRGGGAWCLWPVGWPQALGKISRVVLGGRARKPQRLLLRMLETTSHSAESWLYSDICWSWPALGAWAAVLGQAAWFGWL